MRPIFVLSLSLSVAVSFAQQGHDHKAADQIKLLDFMKGNWVGKQEFVIPNGSMTGEASNRIEDAIGGRYLCEMLSTKMEGRKATDTRHFISFDEKAGKFKAWWFTDTTAGPMELEGDLVDHKLVLMTVPSKNMRAPLRATYECPTSTTFTYMLEAKMGEKWTRLFTTTYSKK